MNQAMELILSFSCLVRSTPWAHFYCITALSHELQAPRPIAK
jgi:hypothetical protein